MSHLDKPLEVPLTVSRGKRRKFVVQPLQVKPPTDWQALITGANGDQDALRDLWQQATQQQAPQQVFDAIQAAATPRSEEHTSELQSRGHLVCRLLHEKKNRDCD